MSELLAPWARLEEPLAARLETLVRSREAIDGLLAHEPLNATPDPSSPTSPARGRPTLRLTADDERGLEIRVDWPSTVDGSPQSVGAAQLHDLAQLLGSLVPGETSVEVPAEGPARLRVRP